MNEDVEITLQTEDVSVETPLVADYILPTATQDTLGGVKIGDNIDIDSSGHISVPIATQSSVGLVKAGTGLAIASDGTLSATGTYELPEATKTTLGGVYVDDELSTTSTHPVQNAVVSQSLAEVTNDISDLSTDVDNLSTGLGNLSTTVGGLSTTVGNLYTQVTTNTNNIGTNASNISSLNSRMSDAEDDIQTLDTNTTTLLTSTYESYDYQDIDDSVWTEGTIDLVGYGLNGYININLEGSLTISNGASNTIFTLPTILPAYTVTGIAITDDSPLMVTITDSGDITLYNLSSSSITLTKLNANLAITIGRDNP